MGYHKFIFAARDLELLTGILSQFDFEAYSEDGDCLEAWIDESMDKSQLESEVRDIAGTFFNTLRIEYVPDQNWNTEWESRFDPVEVGDFCYVRAKFHPERKDISHEIIIDPKQAFGTGHHETTYMMIESMQGLKFDGRRVLDLGCGTGILSILAGKLGATDIIAIDIEQESIENTIENLELNDIKAEVKLGSVEAVQGQHYDVILANINRNAIMFLMEEIVSLMSPGATVLFSGFLEFNYEEVRSRAESLGLSFASRRQKGEWECLEFEML